MIAVFFAGAFVLVSTFVLGYAVALMRPEPQYFPRHSPRVLTIQPRDDTLTGVTVPFTVGSTEWAA